MPVNNTGKMGRHRGRAELAQYSPKGVSLATVYKCLIFRTNVHAPRIGRFRMNNLKNLPKMHPRLISGKVWVPDSGGYSALPENDPKYRETLLWIDSQRFVELLNWVYNRDKPRRKVKMGDVAQGRE